MVATLKRPPLWLLALAVALRAAVLVITGPFDGRYGQDAFSYYDYAMGPLRTALLQGLPLPPYFWPPGYPLLMGLASLVFGPAPVVGQWVALLGGAAVAPLTYLLARELWAALWPGETANRWAVGGPALAGLIVALHPQLWQSSIVVMADAPGLAAATLGAWALARYARTHQLAWLGLSAVTVAYAVLTRWAFALMAMAVTVVALWQLWGLARVRLGAALAQAVVAALAAGVVLAPLIGPLLQPLPASGTRAYAGDLEVYTWNPANALRREFVTADGLLSYRLPNGLYYGALPLHRYYFTPLLAVALLPGLARLWGARRSVAAVGLLAGWPLLIIGFHAGAPWQNFRFGLAALPPLAVLAAAGVAAAAQWRGGRLRGAVAALTLGGLAWLAVGGWQLSHSFIARKQADLARVEAVEAHAPPGARLLTFLLTPTFEHYSRLDTYELWALTEADLAALLAAPTPTFLLLDVANAETQWAGRSPEVNYHWLRDGPGLDLVAQFDAYQLFRVRP